MILHIISHRILPAVVGILLSLLAACGGGESSEGVLRLVSERDSLKAENDIQAKKLEVITDMISTINSVLDSISAGEQMIFVNPNSEIPVSRNDALRNLERYERVLQQQQHRIASLGEKNGNPEMNGMIEIMQQQLAAKDAQIARLKEELSKKNVDIEKLQRQHRSAVRLTSRLRPSPNWIRQIRLRNVR